MGSCSGATFVPQLPELLEDAGEVRVLAVHAVDDDDARAGRAVGDLPGAVGADLRPGDRIDDHERHVRGLDAANDLGDEVRVAGRVDEVDLLPFPLDRQEREVQAELSLVLVLVVVADGVLRPGSVPRRVVPPLSNRAASASIVLPTLPCPTRTTFRMSSVAYTFIDGNLHSYKNDQQSARFYPRGASPLNGRDPSRLTAQVVICVRASLTPRSRVPGHVD